MKLYIYNMKQLKCSYFADGNIKQCDHYRKV